MSRSSKRSRPGGPSKAKRRAPPGSAPGQLRVDPQALPSSVRAVAFREGDRVAIDQPTMARCDELRRSHGVLWLQVHGLGDVELLRQLGAHFGLHRLALEDVVNVHQRPKYERFDDHDFVVTRVAVDDGQHTEQVAMFVGEGFVLTFEERVTPGFERVRTRLLEGGGTIGSRGADYLAYALLDAVVDSFFPELERIDDELDELEDALLDEVSVGAELLPRLHAARRWVQGVRRSILPMREQVSSILRTDDGQFSKDVDPYLRDVYDHIVQLVDLADSQREVVAGLLDLQLSLAGQRLNEVMKLLTIIATIFIPLTFLAGIYGMNFEWMPELKVWWAYPTLLLAMVAIVVSMVAWFRRRGLL